LQMSSQQKSEQTQTRKLIVIYGVDTAD